MRGRVLIGGLLARLASAQFALSLLLALCQPLAVIIASVPARATTLYDLVRMTSPTTGVTNVVALGTALPGFLTFAQGGVPDGATVSVIIGDTGGNPAQGLVGRGTYSAGAQTVTITQIFASTNSGAMIPLSGSEQIAVSLTAEDINGVFSQMFGAGVGVAIAGSTVTITGAAPSPSIYGPAAAVVQSGLTITSPTASLASCAVILGGSGFTTTPTYEILGGLTDGGSASGAALTFTLSAGTISGCSASGGTFSYTPQIIITGPGTGAEIAVTIAPLETISTAAGAIIYNGQLLSVPSFNATYNPALAGTGGYFCDYFSTTSGQAPLTAVPANGALANGCPVESGYGLLRIVATSSTDAAGGVPLGVIGINYVVPFVAGYQYYWTNSKDAPVASTSLPGGNNSGQNYAVMMGPYGSRLGNYQVNGQYFVYDSSDQEPVAYANILDAGPNFAFQRLVFNRTAQSGDYGPEFSFEMLNNAGNGVNVAGLLTSFFNATAGSEQGQFDLFRALPNLPQGVPGFTLRGGLMASSWGGYQCGQFPGPTGGTNLVDLGPSTINLCANGTNEAGNGMGLYLDNLLAINTTSHIIYDSVSNGTGTRLLSNQSDGGLGDLFFPNVATSDILAALGLNQTFTGIDNFSQVLNVTGTLEGKGVAGVTCAAGTPSSIFAVSNGVVTHC